MSNKTKLKEAFEAEASFSAFYTGGPVTWTADGTELICADGNKINIISISEGKLDRSIGLTTDSTDEDTIYCFSLNHGGTSIATVHKSGLIRLWDKATDALVKTWKSSHNGPVSCICFNKTDTMLATGGCDGSVRVWDFEHRTCVGSFRGCSGVIGTLVFHPDVMKKMVFMSGDDNKIVAWNYESREVAMTLSGHFSRVTSVAFGENDTRLVSSSRDKVIIVWDIEKGAQLRVIPVYESIESLFILPTGAKLPNGVIVDDKKMHVCIGGESGTVTIWDLSAPRVIFNQTNSLVTKSADNRAIVQLMVNAELFAVVTADHNILIHALETFHCSKQLIGFTDEILEIVFVGRKDRYLALATNSPEIKFYDTLTMNCQLLKGHTDTVLALSSLKNLLLSSAKDHSIKLWQVEPTDSSVSCLMTVTKHTAAVGSVSFGSISHTMFASVSQDMCLKLWSLPKQLDNTKVEPQCMATQIAHNKDVNCVSISPNDKLIVTASQDKTAKLWNATDLSLLGVLKGHRRGIWSARFSPVDQIVATCSGDGTIKMWTLTDMRCVKTIEGHESSVLRVEFMSAGMQILTAGSDGLIKVWSIKTSECQATLDKHEARVWALALNKNETLFYSGGSDSCLIRWRDVSESKKIAAIEEQQSIVLQEQEMNNLLGQKKMLKALRLALRLERPFLTLKIIESVIKEKERGLDETLFKLSDTHKDALLKHAINWNTNGKHCQPAQLVINILLKEILTGSFRPSNLNQVIVNALPYTDRHFKRMTEYLKDLKFVEYTLGCMQPYARGQA